MTDPSAAGPSGVTPRNQARGLAYSRLRANLRQASNLALHGNIPAARMLLDDAMHNLDDMQTLIDADDQEVSGG